MIGTALGEALRPTADAGWVVEEIGYDPIRESSRESRFSISNGFLGVRGGRAINRVGHAVIAPGTYVAGLFDTLGVGQPISGLLTAADWLLLIVSLPDGPFIHGSDVDSTDDWILDMRRGLMINDCRQMDGSTPGVSTRTLRLVSARDRSIGLQILQSVCVRGGLTVTLEASVGGMTGGLKLESVASDAALWRTTTSGKRLAIAMQAGLLLDGNEMVPTTTGDMRRSWTWITTPGQVISFVRLVAVVRTDAGTAPGPIAHEKLATAIAQGWSGVLAAHEQAWAERWRSSDVEIDGDPRAQAALRFALYHLNGAADPTDDRVSIGARALTGDAYRGHVFWDTEIFLLPFYTLTWPDAARALLKYRFHTLDQARAKARRLGWQGALYAWESSDTGIETTPEQVIAPDRQVVKVLCGTKEQHISADVAYAVWHYWVATGDDAFLRESGAEILIEIGRFWASRAVLEADGVRHIRDVIGPDEYHERIDDNAFTNVMARWSILRAIEVVDLLRARWPETSAALFSRLALDDAETGRWSNVAATLASGLDPKSGLYAQFEGFLGLEHIDLAAYAGRSVPMDVVLGRDRVQASQIIKQADVVALLALLPAEFPAGSGDTNFDFYEPRCSHGSSLSPAMHGIVAARLGKTDMALDYLRRASSIDLSDRCVAIDGGIHIAALGGIWQLVVFGFAGLTFNGDGVSVDPRPPAAWTRLTFPVQWRGRSMRFRIAQAGAAVDVSMDAGEPMTVTIRGLPHDLTVARAVSVRAT
jgi:trehalose/maltose hydrolase-like predicted phosphorylase